jgi:hypothetical protein
MVSNDRIDFLQARYHYSDRWINRNSWVTSLLGASNW